jgi:hypothetical protein
MYPNAIASSTVSSPYIEKGANCVSTRESPIGTAAAHLGGSLDCLHLVLISLDERLVIVAEPRKPQADVPSRPVNPIPLCERLYAYAERVDALRGYVDDLLQRLGT